MTDFPARGQKAPAYWDTQLKAYIDEADATKVSTSTYTAGLATKADADDTTDAIAALSSSTTAALATKADDAAMTTALAGKASTASVTAKANDSAVVHNTGNETVAGVKTFSSAPAVPDASFAQAKVTNLVTDLAAKEPTLSTPSQAEAEAGTATTGRKFSALRVFQAIASYITLNATSIKATLGVASVAYLWSSSGAASITATGSHRVLTAQTLAQARMRTATAPAGSALNVEVQRQLAAGGSWTTLTTLNIAAGATTEDVETVTTSLAVGDLLRLNVTSVGSGTAATGVVVEVYPA